MKAEEALKISKNNKYVSPEQESMEKFNKDMNEYMVLRIFPYIVKEATLGRTTTEIHQSPFGPSIKDITNILRENGYNVKKHWWSDKVIVNWGKR